MIDLLYSEVEEELRASVRALLADHCAFGDVLARCETPTPYDRKLWRTLARDLGTAGLWVPESASGAGASPREVAVVLEELGRFVAPTPYVGSAVLATGVLLALGPVGHGPDGLTAALASGERTATLAVPLSVGPFDDLGRAVAVRATGTGTLTGAVTSVADTALADVLLVPAAGPRGVELYAVEADAVGLTIVPRTSLDLTRPLAEVRLDGVPGQLLTGAQPASAALERALLVGAGLLASEQLGIAEWCLTSAVEHLRERRQFGRQLGSFQGLKHRLADLWVEVAGARAAARYAAGTLADDDPDAPVAVAVAASHCGELAVRAAEECLQLHGGIGMTWEHPVHLRLKRAKTDQIALGTPDHHRTALAELVGLPAPTTP